MNSMNLIELGRITSDKRILEITYSFLPLDWL
jgi:hypothetical protein